jgi:polysaccharide pyruvyl transferase WcaK-like protein
MITPEMVDILNTYDRILARESITYNTLLAWDVTPDLRLLPDIAFGLAPKAIKFPTGFQTGNFVGINISPLVIRREIIHGIMTKKLSELMAYVLEETDMRIALIPHVTMPVDNDLTVLTDLYSAIQEKFKSRVWLISDKLSAAAYKYIISNCRALICSRTHASIAAYATGVPVFVVGYSTKAAGIAHDLGMDEYVADISTIAGNFSFVDALLKLLEHENTIKQALLERIEMCKSTFSQYMQYL